jgi:DNA-binding LytR/AlgR family response regulator
VIVNVDSVFEIRRLLSGDYAVILKDKTELVLSRHYRDGFFRLFDDPDNPVDF